MNKKTLVNSVKKYFLSVKRFKNNKHAYIQELKASNEHLLISRGLNRNSSIINKFGRALRMQNIFYKYSTINSNDISLGNMRTRPDSKSAEILHQIILTD